LRTIDCARVQNHKPSLALILVALLVCASAARADGGNIQRFQPSGTPYAGFSAAAGELLAPGDYVVGLDLDYTHNPLVFRIDGSRDASTVQNNLTLDTSVAIGLLERLEIDLGAPFVLYQNGNDARFPDLPAQAAGDLWIRPKIQILSQARSGIGLTLTPTLVIPVSRQTDFVSESSVRLFPEAGVSYRGEEWFFAGDLIFKWRGPNTTAIVGATVGNELGIDAAVGRILSRDWELIAELTGGVALATANEGLHGNPLEAMLGARYRLGDNWTFNLSGGAGILAAPGTPDARVVFGVMFGSGRPRPAETCVLHDPAGNQTVLKRGTDADHDGVDDACDLCPYTAGPAPTGCPVPVAPLCANGPARIIAPPPPPAVPLKRHVVIKPIEFEFDLDVIRPESLHIVKEMVDEFNKMPAQMHCRVEGHTDKKGRYQYNIDLSSRRAAAVVREMIRLGVDPSRLDSKGYGYMRPLVPNDTEENRQKNRRVEFVFEMPDDSAPTAPPPAPVQAPPASSQPQ